MGYFLQAIIGSKVLLEGHSSDFQAARVAPLTMGFALIPITDELLDEIGASGDSGSFLKFTPAIADWLRAISVSGPVAYVEADYFGGIGAQSSTVWLRGEELLGPTHKPEAINIALRILGVSCGTYRDEFEAIHLGGKRNTEDWADDATE